MPRHLGRKSWIIKCKGKHAMENVINQIYLLNTLTLVPFIAKKLHGCTIDLPDYQMFWKMCRCASLVQGLKNNNIFPMFHFASTVPACSGFVNSNEMNVRLCCLCTVTCSRGNPLQQLASLAFYR